MLAIKTYYVPDFVDRGNKYTLSNIISRIKALKMLLSCDQGKTLVGFPARKLFLFSPHILLTTSLKKVYLKDIHGNFIHIQS